MFSSSLVVMPMAALLLIAGVLVMVARREQQLKSQAVPVRVRARVGRQ